MTFLNIGCGEFRAGDGWTNVDMIRSPPETPHGTYPDVIVQYGEFPFENVERIYYGHLLEHMDTPTVLEFLRGWGGTLAPGALVCVVGPDVNRSLELYKRSELELDHLWQRMEPGAHQRTVDFWLDYYKRELYLHPGYHRVNCTPERARALLEITGYTDIQEIDILSYDLNGWPLVSRSWDQFALMARWPSA